MFVIYITLYEMLTCRQTCMFSFLVYVFNLDTLSRFMFPLHRRPGHVAGKVPATDMKTKIYITKHDIEKDLQV